MEQLLEWMEIIEDVRQHRKVRHSIKDIVVRLSYFGIFCIGCLPCE